MDIGIVSMRYAKALMEYAKSMGAEDTLYKEFCMLDRSFRKHPDLRMALENPILTIREKLTLICTAAVGDAPAVHLPEFSGFVPERQAYRCRKADNSRSRQPGSAGAHP